METTSIQDILIRSRKTILDLLHQSGYNTTPYRKLVASDLIKLLNTPEALAMTLEARSEEEGLQHKQGKRAIVEYEFNSIKQSVGNGDYVNKRLDKERDDDDSKKEAFVQSTELIIIYMTKKIDEDIESYDKGALDAWTKHGLKIRFFPMFRLVNNPLEHVLQPKFEIVPQESHTALLKEWYCRSKTQFPIIKFHNDMVARCLGLIPLDIIKITSYSPTAGEYIKYRVCAP